MVELKWQDPPRHSRKKSDRHTPSIDQLKANPGKWALITKE